MKYLFIFLIGICMAVLFSCSKDQQRDQSKQMDSIAEDYVKLVLNVGLYDPDYIDSYYGPEEWQPSKADKQDAFPYKQFSNEIIRLIELNNEIDTNKFLGLEKQRHTSLAKQLRSVQTKIKMLYGRQYSFDEESELLYYAVAPNHNDNYYHEWISKLENLIPGTGNLSERLNTYKKEFVIPKERLDTVFSVAIAECRNRTLDQIELPENEKFIFELVTKKSWRLYNFYKGNSFSVIQMNTDLPIPIYRAVLGGAHEGYPGHHVFSTLVEKYLVKDKGWIEYSILPLFSPRALIVEGAAVYAQELVMSFNERISFERAVIFPLAGLDSSKVEEYDQIDKIWSRLGFVARSEVARKYLDGSLTEEEATNWLINYGLYSPEQARQHISFIRQYRSYVINYHLGYYIMKKYIESKGGTSDNPQLRWKLFTELISSPVTPSELIKATNENFE